MLRFLMYVECWWDCYAQFLILGFWNFEFMKVMKFIPCLFMPLNLSRIHEYAGLCLFRCCMNHSYAMLLSDAGFEFCLLMLDKWNACWWSSYPVAEPLTCPEFTRICWFTVCMLLHEPYCLVAMMLVKLCLLFMMIAWARCLLHFQTLRVSKPRKLNFDWLLVLLFCISTVPLVLTNENISFHTPCTHRFN